MTLGPVQLDVSECRLFTCALLQLAVTPLSVSHQQPSPTLSITQHSGSPIGADR